MCVVVLMSYGQCCCHMRSADEYACGGGDGVIWAVLVNMCVVSKWC